MYVTSTERTGSKRLLTDDYTSSNKLIIHMRCYRVRIFADFVQKNVNDSRDDWHLG